MWKAKRQDGETPTQLFQQLIQCYESTTQIELDVSDVKAPVKAIHFTDNGGKAWSVLRRLLGAGLGALAESSSDYASLFMAARI